MAAKRRRTAQQEHAADVSTYVAAGGEESVQRVITAVYAVTKKLDQWYVRQFADLDLTQGEWSVLAALARAGDTCLTPSQLADLSNVAPPSGSPTSSRAPPSGACPTRSGTSWPGSSRSSSPASTTSTPNRPRSPRPRRPDAAAAGRPGLPRDSVAKHSSIVRDGAYGAGYGSDRSGLADRRRRHDGMVRRALADRGGRVGRARRGPVARDRRRPAHDRAAG